MTKLLHEAFLAASRLPDEEQDLLALRLLAEIEADDAFDVTLERTSYKLAGLAQQATREDEAGECEPL